MAQRHSTSPQRPTTLAELRASGYQPRSVKDELRDNLLRRLREETPLFPDIIGYEQTVTPLVENAILARHDMIFLGERGQAKTRLIRSLTSLLDEWIPIIAGSEVHDDPMSPISKYGRDLLKEKGEDTPIAWVHRNDRYGEKLATPDVTIGDLIGDIDPIRVAEGRHMSDERVVHFGLVPRVNRGIFALNELPDLPEKVQVGLFNLMEERDIQIRGFLVRLPLDCVVVATANPEDYTNRGRIITPLKDRYQAQIRTHYPPDRATEIAIMRQEVSISPDVVVPPFLVAILAEMTMQAREHSDINQQSGVSVRMSINNLETLVSCALKRAVRFSESPGCPRLTDLPAVLSTSAGKIELEGLGDEVKERAVIEQLEGQAIAAVFEETCASEQLRSVVEAFNGGASVQVGDMQPTADYRAACEAVPGLGAAVAELIDGDTAMTPAAVEFICEGLYREGKLRRDVLETGARYHS